jgi:hypothetical protein
LISKKYFEETDNENINSKLDDISLFHKIKSMLFSKNDSNVATNEKKLFQEIEELSDISSAKELKRKHQRIEIT